MYWTADWIGKKVKVGLFNAIMIEGTLQYCDDGLWMILGIGGEKIFVHGPAIIIGAIPKGRRN